MATVLEVAGGGALRLPVGLRRPIVVQPPSRRLGNGVVQRAVVKVLAAAGGPMRGADVHQAVERLLSGVLSPRTP